MSEWTERPEVVSTLSYFHHQGLRGYKEHDDVYWLSGMIDFDGNKASVFADVHKPDQGSLPKAEVSLHLDLEQRISDEELSKALREITDVSLQVRSHPGIKPEVVFTGTNYGKIMRRVRRFAKYAVNNGYKLVSNYFRV